MRRIGIVGSRPPKPGAPPEDYALFAALLADVDAVVAGLPESTVVVSGGAYGVDARAVRVASDRGLAFAEHLPGDEPSPQRFFLRNQRIVDDSAELIAWVSPWARGTHDSIRRARERGIPVEVRRIDDRTVGVEVTREAGRT